MVPEEEKKRGPQGSHGALWSHTYFQLLDFKAKSQMKKRGGPSFHEFNNQLWLERKENQLSNILKGRDKKQMLRNAAFALHLTFWTEWVNVVRLELMKVTMKLKKTHTQANRKHPKSSTSPRGKRPGTFTQTEDMGINHPSNLLLAVDFPTQGHEDVRSFRAKLILIASPFSRCSPCPLTLLHLSELKN